MSKGTEDWTVGLMCNVIKDVQRSLAEYTCDLPERLEVIFTYKGKKVTIRIEIEEAE